MNPPGNDWNLPSPKIMKDHIAGKRICLDVSLQFGAQVQPDATSDDNSGCESHRGQGMEKARDDPSMAIGQSQEQEGGYSGSSKRQQESPLCHIDGHL